MTTGAINNQRPHSTALFGDHSLYSQLVPSANPSPRIPGADKAIEPSAAVLQHALLGNSKVVLRDSLIEHVLPSLEIDYHEHEQNVR